MANIDWSKMITSVQKVAEARAAKEHAVKSEASRRINLRWDQFGQNNVALGLYSESGRMDCVTWINTHRAACHTIIERNDLLDLDITDDLLWPLVPENHDNQ